MKADDAVVYLRETLPAAGTIREVKMFGGTGFMLNGNLIAGTFRQGLLLRVGKDQQDEALTQPGTRQMEMNGRLMAGYVYFDPSALNRKAIQASLQLAIAYVQRLPPKAKKAGAPASKRKSK